MSVLVFCHCLLDYWYYIQQFDDATGNYVNGDMKYCVFK